MDKQFDSEALLAPYAQRSVLSRGRQHAETPPSGRTQFQRDRDRIIHCAAFRRLEYKTQVFVNHEGDLFRTRLTHSLEVAQIARSIARRLGVNEDLTEAISLAHDLGHTPFGHAGQDALNECMTNYGGFEHNLQSLRTVDYLEKRYGAFDGLNLCFETREGILKHCSRTNALSLGNIGERFLKGHQPSIEAQIANLADEIAYNNHDLDDGLRSGILTIEQLDVLPFWQSHCRQVMQDFPGIEDKRLICETIRRMINTLIMDLIEATQRRLTEYLVQSSEAVRELPSLVAFSEEVREHASQLKKFLFGNLYRHYQVMRMSNKAKHIVQGLFRAFIEEPRLLPPDYRHQDVQKQPRVIADYIAGMTDRYAIKEYQRLFATDIGEGLGHLKL